MISGENCRNHKQLESETFFFFKSFLQRIEVSTPWKLHMISTPKSLSSVCGASSTHFHISNVAEISTSFSARCVPGQGWAGKNPPSWRMICLNPETCLGWNVLCMIWVDLPRIPCHNANPNHVWFKFSWFCFCFHTIPTFFPYRSKTELLSRKKHLLLMAKGKKNPCGEMAHSL